MVSIAGMSDLISFHDGQYCRNVIKKTSFQGWSTSPEQVVRMNHKRWSRWIGIYKCPKCKKDTMLTILRFNRRGPPVDWEEEAKRILECLV